jgi:hypothetical protein
MGKRSRKRARPAGERVVEDPPVVASPEPASASSPRSARRERDKRRRDELPAPPWAPFPLVELSVLLALILVAVGFFTSGTKGAIILVCGIVLGSLSGLEITIREHFAGFKSHTTVLALAVAIAAMAVAFFSGGPRWLVIAVGVPLFVAAFWLLRIAFQRRSGGFSMR